MSRHQSKIVNAPNLGEAGREGHIHLPDSTGGHGSTVGGFTRINEVADSNAQRLKLGETQSHSDNGALAAAIAREISEFDFAAYSKEELSVSEQKNVMRRVFGMFSLSQEGGVDAEQLTALCRYLGGASEPLKKAIEKVTDYPFSFESFWSWWQDNTAVHCADTLAVVSSEFKVPYHQQQIIIEERGEKFTPGFRVYYYFRNMETNEIKRISPWHDIPFEIRDMVRTIGIGEASNRFNFVCEIPKWTRAKFEIATGEQYNPIKQDMKNGVPRFYKHGDMMWNYGAFPQTWESTEVVFEAGVTGDNDPIDCIEIGMTQLSTGSVTPVKVIGVLGMVDDGQMDWKIIAIAAGDPIERFINDIDDVPKYLPGCLIALREWLRVYKICQGGVENKFVFNGEYQNKAFALKLLHESHMMWGNLRKVQNTEHFQ